MYYKKLKQTYHNTDCHELYPSHIIQHFDTFIRRNVKNRTRYLSPYRFSLETNLTVKDSVRFFLYFVGDNRLLDIIPFVECPNTSCPSSRIFIDTDYTVYEEDDVLICEDCGREYFLEDIRPFIKVYFKLSRGIEIPEKKESLFPTDPNSTFDALMELPDHLKAESPSSLEDEGDIPDPAVEFSTVNDSNKNSSGKPISPVVERLKNKVLSVAMNLLPYSVSDE